MLASWRIRWNESSKSLSSASCAVPKRIIYSRPAGRGHKIFPWHEVRMTRTACSGCIRRSPAPHGSNPLLHDAHFSILRALQSSLVLDVSSQPLACGPTPQSSRAKKKVNRRRINRPKKLYPYMVLESYANAPTNPMSNPPNATAKHASILRQPVNVS